MLPIQWTIFFLYIQHWIKHKAHNQCPKRLTLIRTNAQFIFHCAFIVRLYEKEGGRAYLHITQTTLWDSYVNNNILHPAKVCFVSKVVAEVSSNFSWNFIQISKTTIAWDCCWLLERHFLAGTLSEVKELDLFYHFSII